MIDSAISCTERRTVRHVLSTPPPAPPQSIGRTRQVFQPHPQPPPRGFREGSASAGCGGLITRTRYSQSLSTVQVNESPFPNALGFLPPVEAGGSRGGISWGWGCTGRERNDETCRVLSQSIREGSAPDAAGACRRDSWKAARLNRSRNRCLRTKSFLNAMGGHSLESPQNAM